MDLYAENILDHYRHPRGQTALTDADAEHKEINVSCGDELTLQLKIKDGKITELGWDGTGCAISQAGMSMLSEELIGKTTAEAEMMTRGQIDELLAVPIGPRRFKCAYLCLHTLKNTLRTARGEALQGWTETVGRAL